MSNSDITQEQGVQPTIEELAAELYADISVLDAAHMQYYYAAEYHAGLSEGKTHRTTDPGLSLYSQYLADKMDEVLEKAGDLQQLIRRIS